MLQSIKQLIYPFRSSSPGKLAIAAKLHSRSPASAEDNLRGNDMRNTDSGYALLFAMLAATIVLIGLTVVLPSIYQEGQREREEELIFRGFQYARAIASFHQKFQRYPTSIQDLTKQTNGWRFLRKEYADPMTPKGKWRFIHANAQGILLDSKTQGPPPGAQGLPGTGQGAGGFGTSGSSGMGGTSFGQQGMGGSGFGQQAMGGSSFGQQGMGGGFGQQSTGSSGFGPSAGGFSSDSNPGGNPSNTQQNSGFFGAGIQGGGTFIVGVASTSHKPSIRTYNQKTHYDEWEFLGIDLGALGIATSLPGLPQGVQSGQGSQPTGFGGQSGQGFQSNGFGQQPQGNPMTPGQNQGMSPPSDGSTFSPQ
jgi:type II secretory pathway pseudopilin PulG